MDAELISLLLRTEVVIDARRHPELRESLRGLARRGRLTRVMPDVYADPGQVDDPRVRAVAVSRAFTGVVIAGAAAAVLTFAPDLTVEEVEAYRHGGGAPRAGCRWLRGRPPPELVDDHDGIRLTTPALTALDLVDRHGGDIIDRVLRSGVGLGRLWEALSLTRQRPGNRRRRQLLVDSRDEPWSELERKAHRLLRDAGLTGWHSNHPIVVAARCAADGVELPECRYLGDVVWVRERLIVEFDGWTFHSGQESFHSDRWRDARLHDAGWMVLRFTASHVDDTPDEVIEVISSVLRQRTLR